jgi:3-oxoacyl-[acyl-carrier protein] reductase
MKHDLSKRVALVTGASRGLGESIAVKLGECGAKVAVNYFASPEKAERVVERIKRAGGDAQAFKADVRDEGEVARLVRDTESRFGPIDILIPNGTGPQPFISIEKLTWQACLDQLEFFVKSPMLLAKGVVPGMKQRKWGRIINLGSEAFEKGVAEFSSYTSAKGAQVGLTRSWAMELATFGITVNIVSPGWIPTERHKDEPEQNIRAYAATVPMRRLGVPDDVGNAVAFLASDAANFITGQRLSVNGGNSLG